MATNRFAHCKSIGQMEGLAEALLSPENLHCDGEVTPAYAQQKGRAIMRDYESRKKELLLVG